LELEIVSLQYVAKTRFSRYSDSGEKFKSIENLCLEIRCSIAFEQVKIFNQEHIFYTLFCLQHTAMAHLASISVT